MRKFVIGATFAACTLLGWHSPSMAGGAVDVHMDVLPRQCPNMIMIDPVGVKSEMPRAAAALLTLTVAILGSADYSVMSIMPMSVRLEGIAPRRYRMGDVTGPPASYESTCECVRRMGDGFPDLILEFDQAAVVQTQQPVADGEWRKLHMSCEMGGYMVDAYDCAQFIYRQGRDLNVPKHADGKGAVAQLDNHPNPFNAATVIGYSLDADGPVTLEVYNLLGRRVATLVDGFETSGPHEVTWNSLDHNGREVASGMYFYRLTTATATDVRKMMLLR